MNIGIVGYGAVGEACARGFEHIGHSVIPHDIKLNSKLSDLILISVNLSLGRGCVIKYENCSDTVKRT